MGRLKANKEIIILLLIVIYLYGVMTVGGCAAKPIGPRDMLNSDLDVVLLCENFQGDPYLELVKKGMVEAQSELSMHSKIELLSLDSDTELVNKKMNEAALKNNLVIVAGGWLKNAVMVSCRELRARNFIIIDESLKEPNVKSIIYKNQEGAFLMGLIAGGETKTNKVGFIGGLNNEEGEAFLSGYSSGVKVMNDEAYSQLIDYSQVRYTEEFRDESKAYEKAKNLYINGCDIIFHSCGSAGKGVFRAALEMNKKAIGVDVDCAEVFPEYKSVIISSMIKKLDRTVLEVCKEIRTGTFKSGGNNITKLGIKENVFGWAESTKQNVSAKTYENIIKYNMLIEESIIEVPAKMFKVIEFKPK